MSRGLLQEIQRAIKDDGGGTPTCSEAMLMKIADRLRALTASPVNQMEAFGRDGFTVSICCGPCGAEQFCWSVQTMNAGQEFDQPFAARDFAHAVEIAEMEVLKWRWR